jgi:hypothetical protein
VGQSPPSIAKIPLTAPVSFAAPLAPGGGGVGSEGIGSQDHSRVPETASGQLAPANDVPANGMPANGSEPLVASAAIDATLASTGPEYCGSPIKAIARRGMPVGVLAWAGHHAQILTGYAVVGEDPRVSDRFTVRYVNLSDPLKRDALVNRKLSYDAFKAGALVYRFRRYLETDSARDDPYVAGTIAGSISPALGRSEWYGRWVAVMPVRTPV